MPELPEIEIIKRGLKPFEKGIIKEVEASDPDIFTPPLSPGKVVDFLQGEKLDYFDRYGKYLLINMDGSWLIFHPRMSGKVWNQNEPPEKPDRVKLVLEFTDPDLNRLYFTSMRRFTRFYWCASKDYSNHEKLNSLGPDPLKDNYNREALESSFKGRRAGLKALLMDQSFLAGIGNIYASEICFDIKIDPCRRANEIDDSERERLYRSIPRILKESISAGGSSLQAESSATTYRNTGGQTGSYTHQHRVYGREGKQCLECSSPIKKIKFSGRSTYFCPSCQE